MANPFGGASEVFRDFNISGDVGSGLYPPDKGQISALMSYYEGQLGAQEAVLSTIGWKPRASEPVHQDFKLQINGTWWSPDWFLMAVGGQSNAGENINQITGDKTVDPNVFALDNTTGLLGVATLGQEPFSTFGGAPNSIGFNAGKRVSPHLQRPVALVNEPVGGSEFGTWLASLSGANWATLEAAIGKLFTDASGALWGKNTIDAFLWHHGEAFADYDPLDQVADDLYPELVEQVLGASWAASDMQFVAGEVLRETSGAIASKVNQELRRFAAQARYGRFHLASSHGLQVLADKVHATGDAIVEFGHRYGDIINGTSTGMKSAGADYLAMLPDIRFINGEAYALLVEMSDAPSNTSPQDIIVITPRADTVVVFEVNGVDNDVTSSTSATYQLADTDPATVRVWFPADAMKYEPPGFTRSSPVTPGTMESLRIGKQAKFSSFFISHHAALEHSVTADEFRSVCKTIRIQSCPKVDFSRFRPNNLSETVTLVNLSGAIVPPEVQAELTALAATRGPGFDYSQVGVTGPGRAVLPFRSVTDMTASIQGGLTALDGSVAVVADQVGLNYSMLIAAAGAPAVAGKAPAGWVDATPSAGNPLTTRTIYVSPTGSGDGALVSTPANLDDARTLAKELFRLNSHVTVTLKLAAGTYTDAVRWNLDDGDWYIGYGMLVFEGAAAPAGINTTIFSSATVSGLIRKQDMIHRPVRVSLTNIHFTGYPTQPVNIRYEASVLLVGCSSDCPGGLVNVREGRAEILAHPVGTAVGIGQRYRIVTVASADWSSVGGSATAAAGDKFTATAALADTSALGTVAPLTLLTGFTNKAAVTLHECRSIIGDYKLSTGEAVARGFDFGAGSYPGIHVSRGTARIYIVGNVCSGADSFLHLSHITTARGQANELDSFGSHGLFMDGTCRWDNDPNFPNRWAGASATTPAITTEDGRTPESTAPAVYAHRAYTGPQYQIDSTGVDSELNISEPADGGLEELGAVRMPAFFLFSPSARVKIKYEFETSDANIVTFSVRLGTGDLATITLPDNAGSSGLNRWTVDITIYGPKTGENKGYYEAIATSTGVADAVKSQGDTTTLDNVTHRSPSGDIQDWKFYVKQSDAAGWVRVINAQCPEFSY